MASTSYKNEGALTHHNFALFDESRGEYVSAWPEEWDFDEDRVVFVAELIDWTIFNQENLSGRFYRRFHKTPKQLHHSHFEIGEWMGMAYHVQDWQSLGYKEIRIR